MTDTKHAPTASPALPPIDKSLSRKIYDYLTTAYDIRRPPEMASDLLAFLVSLHKKDMPYPDRRAVAKHLNASVFGLDAAINRAMERGLLKIEMRQQAGNISGRSNIILVKHYLPTKELLDAL